MMCLITFLHFFKEYKRLEREIDENWSTQTKEKQQQEQFGVILSAATAFTEKLPNN